MYDIVQGCPTHPEPTLPVIHKTMSSQLKQTEIYEIGIRPAIAIYVLHEIKHQANLVTGTCMSKIDIIISIMYLHSSRH